MAKPQATTFRCVPAGARAAGRFSQEPDETGAGADGGFAVPGAEMGPLRVMASRAGLPAPPDGPPLRETGTGRVSQTGGRILIVTEKIVKSPMSIRTCY